MLSHVMIGIGDFDRAYSFYAALAAELGLKPFFTNPEASSAAWRGKDGGRPNLFIGRPFDKQPMAPSNGGMIAFLAEDRPTVDRCHAAAMAHGGTDEGAPRLRDYYHPNYYGAYFRDPDGNKLCVVCHAAR